MIKPLLILIVVKTHTDPWGNDPRLLLHSSHFKSHRGVPLSYKTNGRPQSAANTACQIGHRGDRASSSHKTRNMVPIQPKEIHSSYPIRQKIYSDILFAG